mmetsp:Transcript_84832/g.245281  ORF Transcript_84832/g.245281 Transcript_84832/m.245281 type:complete len:178 (-) Transcript_84832:329-862(-)
MTATLDELKQALVETLETRGVLGQVKAKVRAEIFAALDDEVCPRPELPKENAVINELIREYLEFNGYHHTTSVLLPESGHPEERQFDRPFLASELGIREDDRSRSLPLLYALARSRRDDEPPAGRPARGGRRDDETAAAFDVSAALSPSAAAPGEVAAAAEDDDQPPPMVIRGGRGA